MTCTAFFIENWEDNSKIKCECKVKNQWNYSNKNAKTGACIFADISITIIDLTIKIILCPY